MKPGSALQAEIASIALAALIPQSRTNPARPNVNIHGGSCSSGAPTSSRSMNSRANAG